MQKIKYHFDVDSINNNDDVCHFENNNKSKLLVTIGESWTWGDSLEQNGHSRLDCIWGKHLSTLLDTDWLNIARKGASNLWIFFQLEELVRYGKLEYDHIQIVTCCTEWGREYEENWSWHNVDLNVKTPVMQNFELINYARQYINKLNAKILITHNFCDASFWRHDMPQLEKNWIEVTCDNLKLTYDYVIPTVSHYDKLKKTQIRLEDLIYLQNRSLKLCDFLTASKYNYKKATMHPTPESHKFWAEHIYRGLNEK